MQIANHKNISGLLSELTNSTKEADCNDLTALAQLHNQFQSLEQAIQAAELPESAQKLATHSASIVEQIVLGEVDSAQAALEGVQRAIEQIESLLEPGKPTALISESVTVATALPSAPAPEASAVAATSSAVTEVTEEKISRDDLPLVTEFVGEASGHIETAEACLLRLEDNPQDEDAICSIFRAFHTIKGVAGFLNLRQIGLLSHGAENLLDLGRRKQLQITGAAADLVLESIDLTKSMLLGLETAASAGQTIAIEPRLPSLLERLEACAAGKMVMDAVKEKLVQEPTSAVGKTASNEQHGASDATVKVSTERLDGLINMVGELVVAQLMVGQGIGPIIGDNQRLAKNMAHLGKITRELQDLSMSMRMVPIQGVFQKMGRLVRDLTRKAMKNIDLEVVGGETELDRNMVEALSDPLLHMVRNAADHGIESPDEREKAGKSRTGHIQLRARHQAGQIIIEITDDGRGLNREKILKKARDTGLIKEGQELSEQEIFRMIFAPGFSTADKVTDISGRGVGMDVVKKNIDALRGRVDIRSEVGRGSTFTIQLPLTLAVIDGLVVKVGDQRYILPITSVEKSLRPRPQELSTIQNRGEVCMVRGTLMPLIRLHRLFKVTPQHEDPAEALVVIVQNNEQQCCLLVDELIGQQQVVIKCLGEVLGSVPGVSGGAILGDGNISLILDVPGLMKMAGN
ncbi:MAG: chemotaxis protein CheA [Phycisphaerales bacterium]|nr:chemotaxis protein CheA [Phycisphaerales bacterium]